jgi:hypothetical protein
MTVSSDGEPKGWGENLAVTRVLAQPERHRRADGIYGYLRYPESENRGVSFSGALYAMFARSGSITGANEGAY